MSNGNIFMRIVVLLLIIYDAMVTWAETMASRLFVKREVKAKILKSSMIVDLSLLSVNLLFVTFIHPSIRLHD
jgi:hypothetical protein